MCTNNLHFDIVMPLLIIHIYFIFRFPYIFQRRTTFMLQANCQNGYYKCELRIWILFKPKRFILFCRRLHFKNISLVARGGSIRYRGVDTGGDVECSTGVTKDEHQGIAVLLILKTINIFSSSVVVRFIHWKRDVTPVFFCTKCTVQKLWPGMLCDCMIRILSLFCWNFAIKY